MKIHSLFFTVSTICAISLWSHAGFAQADQKQQCKQKAKKLLQQCQEKEGLDPPCESGGGAPTQQNDSYDSAANVAAAGADCKQQKSDALGEIAEGLKKQKDKIKGQCEEKQKLDKCIAKIDDKAKEEGQAAQNMGNKGQDNKCNGQAMGSAEKNPQSTDQCKQANKGQGGGKGGGGQLPKAEIPPQKKKEPEKPKGCQPGSPQYAQLLQTATNLCQVNNAKEGQKANKSDVVYWYVDQSTCSCKQQGGSATNVTNSATDSTGNSDPAGEIVARDRASFQKTTFAPPIKVDTDTSSASRIPVNVNPRLSPRY